MRSRGFAEITTRFSSPAPPAPRHCPQRLNCALDRGMLSDKPLGLSTNYCGDWALLGSAFITGSASCLASANAARRFPERIRRRVARRLAHEADPPDTPTAGAPPISCRDLFAQRMTSASRSSWKPGRRRRQTSAPTWWEIRSRRLHPVDGCERALAIMPACSRSCL